MNQMLINVSIRRFRRSVRLPDGDVASARGDGTSKSAVSRKFVALSSLPKELRRSLACTNFIENMNGTIRQVTRNVKRWRDASMALRWTAAGMIVHRRGRVGQFLG